MFVATIVNVVLLLILVVGAVVFKGVVRRWDNVDADISIHDESRTGLDDVFNYMVNGWKFVKVKFLVEGGSGLEDALEVEEYDE